MRNQTTSTIITVAAGQLLRGTIEPHRSGSSAQFSSQEPRSMISFFRKHNKGLVQIVIWTMIVVFLASIISSAAIMFVR
ncbi:MAG TPA: hypothetical protein V6C72_12530 [Chroococcales cyanobacterium]